MSVYIGVYVEMYQIGVVCVYVYVCIYLKCFLMFIRQICVSKA